MRADDSFRTAGLFSPNCIGRVHFRCCDEIAVSDLFCDRPFPASSTLRAAIVQAMTSVPKKRVRRGSAPGLLRDAARQVFAERGYGVTTREIADRAGVSHELIFRYFESKEKLFFEAVVNPLLDTVDALHQRWFAGLSDGAMNHEAFVRQFITEFYTFLSENRAIAQAMTSVFSQASTGGAVDHLRARIDATISDMAASLDSHLVRDGGASPQPELQLRVMLLSIGTVADTLPMTYATEDAVPPTPVVVDVLVNTFTHMWQ